MVDWKKMFSLGGRVQQRFLLTFMLLMAIINTYTMRVSLNIALVEMCQPVKAKMESGLLTKTYDFDWDYKIQGQIKGAFYYGYVITHVPGGYLADRYGGKWVLFSGIASTSLFTFLIPEVSRAGGWPALFALRILTGLGEGTIFPAIGVLLAKWVPLKERSRIGSIVLSGAQLGTVVTNAVTGLTLHYWPWEYTFYFYGVLGVIFGFFWIILCFSVPADHPYITDKELNYLNELVAPKKKVKRAPLKSILTSLPVWGLIIGQIGHDWGLFTMIHELPSYMKDILNFNIKENGLLNALPYLCMWICSLVLGVVADKIVDKKKMSVANVRILLTALASVIPAAGMLALTFPKDRYVAVAVIVLGMAGMGGYYPGMRVNGFDITKNYAGTVVGLHNGLGALSGAVSPTLRGYLTPTSSLEEWRLVYIISAVILVVTCAFYASVAKGERQIWDYQDDETPPEPKKKFTLFKRKDANKENDGTLQPTSSSQPPPPAQKVWWWPF